MGRNSPQIQMGEHLKKRFTKVDVWYPTRENLPPAHNWDVIFAAMEVNVPVGFQISQKLNIPIYSHWEWIPPYRINGYSGGDDPLNWGFREEHLKNHYKNLNWYNYYKSIIEGAIGSNINSCAGHTFKQIAKEFSGNELEKCFIKYPTCDFPETKIAEDKGEYFITVSRLVTNKRVVELANAVKIANLDTNWVVIGDGSEKRYIQNILKDSKTKVHFLSNTNGAKKKKLLSHAKFQLSSWHGLPQLEAAHVNTPTINIDIPYIRELYGDTLTWVKNEEEMAETIKVFNSDKALCSKKSDILYEAAYEKKININTLERGADIIEEALLKVAS